MSKKTKKKAPPYFYEGPPLDRDDTEDETEDIYDSKEREKMLEEDEITPAEEGFMIGREQEAPSKKKTLKNAQSHYDSISDELAKEDAEDS